MLVKSSDASRRHLLRSTWLTQRDVDPAKVLVVWRFFVSRPADEALAANLTAESERHADVVVLDMPDEPSSEFFQLFLKVGTAFAWACRNIPSADVLFKVDGDAFVHLPRLAELLVPRLSALAPDQHLFLGQLIVQHAVTRSNVSANGLARYWTSEDDFPFPVYPPYMQGGCYALTRALACRVAGLIVAEPCANLNNGMEDALMGVMVEIVRLQGWRVERVAVPGWQGLLSRGFFNIPARIVVLHKLQGEHTVRTLYEHDVVQDLGTGRDRLVRCPRPTADVRLMSLAQVPVMLYRHPEGQVRRCVWPARVS